MGVRYYYAHWKKNPIPNQDILRDGWINSVKMYDSNLGIELIQPNIAYNSDRNDLSELLR